MIDREEKMKRWLEGCINGGHQVEPLAGDASFRRYFRVRSGEQTWVVMDAPPEREDTEPFARIAERLDIPGLAVPRVEAADRDEGFLLLRDLGDDLYLSVLRPENAERLYSQAIDALVRMQHQVPANDLPVYDRDRLHQEMMLFPEWFLAVHLRYEPSGRELAELEGVMAFLEDAALAQPYRFVHRDYHSRNLLVVGADLGVLDFQDAVRGPVSYDLASLLRDVYIEWSEAQVRAWVAYYRRRAIEDGLIDVDEPTLWRWFELMAAQRLIKVAGIFARLNYRDAKATYLGDLPLTLRYLGTIVARYRELAPLGRLLRVLEPRLGAAPSSR